MDEKTLSKRLKALADPTRRHMIALIHQGEQCGCELIHCLDVSQPTMSHHLKILSDAALIKGVKTKTRINYTVRYETIEAIHKALDTLLERPTIQCEE